LAHLLLVKLGNIGITEWMFREIAFHHGIELGRFNYTEGISWNFKALLTPDRNEFSKWFSEKAFQEYILQDEGKSCQMFSFKKIFF
jgi:hypothetical protein